MLNVQELMHYSIKLLFLVVVVAGLCMHVCKSLKRSPQDHHCSAQYKLTVYTGSNLMGEDHPKFEVDAGEKFSPRQDNVIDVMEGRM